MLLITSLAILTAVVVAGSWLGGRYLLLEIPPVGLRWPGLVHGAAGLAGFAVLVAALRGPAPSQHAVSMGVGGFGKFACALVAGALLAGGTILLTHLRHRPVSVTLVATHGLLGIAGYTLLLTYLTMLH